MVGDTGKGERQKLEIKRLIDVSPPRLLFFVIFSNPPSYWPFHPRLLTFHHIEFDSYLFYSCIFDSSFNCEYQSSISISVSEIKVK